MKKQNQYYSQEFWEYISQNEEKWSKKSLYEVSIKKQQWIQENYNHRKHEKILNWKKYLLKKTKTDIRQFYKK